MPYNFLEYLDSAVSYTVLALVFLNIAFNRKLSSVGIASIGFLFVQACSLVLAKPIREDLFEFDPQLSEVAFFFTFAFIDLIAIVVIYRLHNIAAASIERSAIIVVRCLQLLAIGQVLRFIDRKLDLNLLFNVYQYFVPACNTAILMTLVYYTIKQFMYERNSAGVKGIKGI